MKHYVTANKVTNVSREARQWLKLLERIWAVIKDFKRIG